MPEHANMHCCWIYSMCIKSPINTNKHIFKLTFSNFHSRNKHLEWIWFETTHVSTLHKPIKSKTKGQVWLNMCHSYTASNPACGGGPANSRVPTQSASCQAISEENQTLCVFISFAAWFPVSSLFSAIKLCHTVSVLLWWMVYLLM